MSTSSLDSPEVIEETKLFDDVPSCECLHGTEEESVPCGAPVSFRLVFGCDCEENHGKLVVLRCAPCANEYIERFGTYMVTIIPL